MYKLFPSAFGIFRPSLHSVFLRLKENDIESCPFSKHSIFPLPCRCSFSYDTDSSWHKRNWYLKSCYQVIISLKQIDRFAFVSWWKYSKHFDILYPIFHYFNSYFHSEILLLMRDTQKRKRKYIKNRKTDWTFSLLTVVHPDFLCFFFIIFGNFFN